MKKILILILLFVSSCGYEPIYKLNQDTKNFEVGKAELKGNKNISKKILSKLPFLVKQNNELLNTLFIESKNSVIETSRNSKGQAETYKTIISVNIELINVNNDVVFKKFIKKEFSYNSDDNKLKFKKNQNEIEKNLINKIIEDIITHLKI